jgi:hypothetical protein
MEKKKLSKEEKVAILTAKIKATRQKISKLEGIEKRKQRRQRARQLIEVAAYFFGDHYGKIHEGIKSKSQITIELKQKLDEWQNRNL